ncbi:MAG: polysaccharide biosynthesis tyrosine autokinase [Calditrichaceae bacterium]
MLENMDQEFESQVSVTDYLRILYQGRWIIIISFIIVLIATVYLTFTTPPQYEATTTIMIESSDAMERTIFDINYFGNQNTMMFNQIEILKSRSLAEKVIKRLDLSDVRDSLQLFQPSDEGEYMSMRAMVAILQNNMSIEQKRDTDIIDLTYSAGSPFEAAYIANVIASEFQIRNAETNRSEVSELKDFVQERLDMKKAELEKSENALRDYQEQEKVASLDAETSELVNRMAEAESMLEQSRVELQANLELKRSVTEQLEQRKQTLSDDLSEISTPYLQSLQEQLAAAVAERTLYITALEAQGQTPNKQYYEQGVQEYDNKIKALREKLQEEADAEIKATTAKIEALQEVVQDYNTKLESLPVKVLELARLERRRKVDEENFIFLTQKLEEIKIQEAGQSKNVRIIDDAIEPLFPVKPKKKLNLMLGVLIGLGLGIGLAFLKEYFDNTIKSHEEIERMGFNILASIPQIQMDKYEKKLERKLEKVGSIEGRKIESRLITHLDPKSPVSEAYRTLRTNLQFSKVDRKLKSFLITSSGPKEGKSTTAANLAIALAQVGQKVVLVDADLRRPVVHSIFGMKKDEGVTNYLMDTIKYDQILKPTFNENLVVICSGVLPPNPSELLASKSMESLMERLTKDFDVVIFDSPPVIAVTDAAIMSTKVDGTILVVNSGQTNRDALTRCTTLLESVGTRPLGILLNGVNVEGMYGSYYYYYYHHYYSKPGRKKKKNMSKIISA